MKKHFFIFSLILAYAFLNASAQTDYTNKINNPSFETGSLTGWTFSGATGFTWSGVNTDGDASKTGSYIAGIWNASISDVELSQNISGLDNGMYQITADLMGSKNATTSRLTSQRLFANGVSQLFGTQSAYSTENLAILNQFESYSFGGYVETLSDIGPFKKLSITAPVTNGTLTLGVKTNGKSSVLGFSFPNLTAGDGHGWFKVDNFTLTYIGELTSEIQSNAYLRSIKISNGTLSPVFNREVYQYNVLLSAGTTTVQPTVFSEISGVQVSGLETVNLSTGSGTSTIVVNSIDGTNTKNYIVNYSVAVPAVFTGTQQDRLYSNEFPLSDITLFDSPFKHARDINIQTLLKYDVDRLLAPYRKQAGLSAKAISYPNWDGLDGHIGGHYLTALAINYAATSDANCKQLMDYMVTELKACQDANTIKNSSWGIGYAGGVPSSANVWSTFKALNLTAFNASWVAWYNLHKTYAGLRDAWLYGRNETSKTVFLSFCDWGINITSAFSDAQMESMLDVEHGGMNEIYADAYQMTGNSKYLTAAKRFSHKTILNSMAVSVDNLDNIHANTQVPKIVGFDRIAEVSKDATYAKAAQFFWQTVTQKRSLSSGGNSRKEYFPQASACMDYINDIEGPESCNTNNMLKLTGDLFRVSPQAKYADYYERALYNHILSTQHPDHGGYVYFTPARPQHYRVYSAPGQAMWCCVGTGMENHGKYGEFIYTHTTDSLFLNLFIASELDWKAKSVKITQTTTFPEEEKTQLKITCTAPTAFTLMVRSPKWVAAGALKIVINTDTLAVVSTPQSYIPISRTWNNGDSIRILLPMQNTIEQLPNVASYVALMHGPILLGAKTGTEDLTGLVADDSRWGHIANGTMQSLDKAPIIVSSRDSIPLKLSAVPGKALTFKAKNLFADKADSTLILEPFYKIHDARYMMYWLALTKNQYQTTLDSLAAVQKAELELEARTLDKVAPGEQQPEVDHKLNSQNSYTGNYMNEFWRDARNGGYISYSMLTKGKSDLSVMARFWGNESGVRSFYIQVDGETIATENLIGKWSKNEFVNVEYPIPNTLTAGKDTIVVTFRAINSSNIVGGLFYVRLLQPSKSTAVPTIKTNDSHWKVFARKNEIIVSGLTDLSFITVYNSCGHLLKSLKTNESTLNIPKMGKGIRIIKIVSGDLIEVAKVNLTMD